MNTKILQKCVEELKKDTYSKEYVLGMLETIIEMNSINKEPTYEYKTPEIKGMVTHTNVDEAREEIPAFLRAA